jgi:glycosyltransferase involved in cell wall biosynthesis
VKILVLSHVSDYVGGAERSILDVIDYWKSQHKDLKVEFILRKPLGSYVNELKKRKYKYHAVDYIYWNDSNLPKDSDKERLFITSLRNARAIKEIEQIIVKVKPDYVITNSIVAPWAAFAAYYQGIPHVWFVREYGDLDHGRDFEIGAGPTFTDIGNLSELVVSNSKTLAEYVGHYIDSRKIVTLYNPFNLDDLRNRANEIIENPFVSNDSLKLVLTSGGITPSKGHLDSVKAVGTLVRKGYDIELVFVGRDGPKDFMSQLKNEIDSYGIKNRVHFVGYQKNPLAYVKKADVGIMASNKEAFGRVTFEYMAIGTPVVGANSGATPEIVDDKVSGLLYKVGDVNDLAKKIEIYANNKNLIKKHGEEAIKKTQIMMSGKNNPGYLYDQIIKMLDKKLQKTVVINYTHRWLDYPAIAYDYINSMNEMSISRLIYKKMRQRAKKVYIVIRGLYAKVAGK